MWEFRSENVSSFHIVIKIRNLTKIIFRGISNIPLDDSSWFTISISIAVIPVAREESVMMPFRANSHSEFWLPRRVKTMTNFFHQSDFLLQHMMILLLGNTVPEVENTVWESACVLLEIENQRGQEIFHIVGGNDFLPDPIRATYSAIARPMDC